MAPPHKPDAASTGGTTRAVDLDLITAMHRMGSHGPQCMNEPLLPGWLPWKRSGIYPFRKHSRLSLPSIAPICRVCPHPWPPHLGAQNALHSMAPRNCCNGGMPGPGPH
eukprot:5617912-Prorocentrum_lima.AAC.1